ncbi:DUF2332 domain-containing protein [Neptunicoccus sediminis]|uniref:DUF2332 domain-containing protein n=1 Tax=Neptunicoccus sediminis TaxID=1892596 RepID=UPI000B0AA8BC|nr:DUF2332 family protein [Neptunicoccus sediminis]
MALDRSAFERQATWCRQLGSEFTSALLLALLETLDGSTATGRRVMDWPGAAGPMRDVVPLRLSGAFHAMVLSEQSPTLAALYPPNPMPAQRDLEQAVAETLQKCDAQILDFLNFAPQTNEVARASLLMAGLALIGQQSGRPLVLYEIGSSGGLNLNLERFSHQLGAVHLGDEHSELRLAPQWRGTAPRQMPVIAARQGCDVNPIRVEDPKQALRLLAYIWPDQPDRLSRTRAAIALAQKFPPELHAADAGVWVEQMCQPPAPRGQTRVLMHSITWQYLPETTQQKITRAMEEAGRNATAESPLAWLSFELNDQGKAQLTLRMWPDQGAFQLLADANPHVQEVCWHGLQGGAEA